MIALPKIAFLRDFGQRLLRISNILASFPNIPFLKFLLPQALVYARSETVYQDLQNVVLNYSIIIKHYVSKNEKGILLISFEKELQKILRFKTLDAIQERYHIVFLPSSHGFFSSPLIVLAARARERFYVMPVHARERRFSHHLGPYCRALPFNAASWVKKEFFCSYQGDRDIDCLMVANFAEVKRHWLLFKALSRLPSEIKAYCVGVPLGIRTADSLRQEAKEYDVLNRIVIVEGPTQEELRMYYQRARVFCALSYREGSFIAVAESLLAGTPVIYFKNAQFGTKELLTSNNGAMVSSISELRKKILFFREHDNHENIRKTSQREIASSVNCIRLNQLLKETALSSGEEWSTDIERIYCMRFWFYYESTDWRFRLENDYSYLKERGIEIKGFV
ncbi:MAG: glycosyltransferase [Thermodesulfobacteriota bacterium]